MEDGIEAQGGDQAHFTLPAGVAESNDTVGLIAEHGDGDLRQPTPHHPDHLACPLRDGPVPPTAGLGVRKMLTWGRGCHCSHSRRKLPFDAAMAWRR